METRIKCKSLVPLSGTSASTTRRRLGRGLRASLSTEAFWGDGPMFDCDEAINQLEQIASTLGMPVSVLYQSGVLRPFGSSIPEIQRMMVDILRALEAMSDPKARRHFSDAIGQAILHLEQTNVGGAKAKGN